MWIAAGGVARLQDASTIGARVYEFTDHLGNVTYTAQDRKYLVQDSYGQFQYFPSTVTYTDYYPFGYPMPGRSSYMGGYRYFFNGQEADNEVLGEGGFQNYSFRMYDTRIARFWGVDPLAKDYPMLTPFQFASCSPVLLVDVDGLEGKENTPGNMEGGVVHTYFNASQSTYVAPKWFTSPSVTTSELQILSYSYLSFGEISVPGPLSGFELWLETPPKNFFDGLSKFGFNFVYSTINSPYSLVFGKTISGSYLTPNQRMDAFVDFVPGLVIPGLTSTNQIIRTEGGLQGYNNFVNEYKKMGLLPKKDELPPNMKWQTSMGMKYQVNKSNERMLDEVDYTFLFLSAVHSLSSTFRPYFSSEKYNSSKNNNDDN